MLWERIYNTPDVVAVIHQHRLELALSWTDGLKLPAGTRVLEVGCGAGLATVALAERGFVVDATDPSGLMLEHTRERVGRSGVSDRIRVGHADAHVLLFPDNSFDLVMALGVYPWLHSPKQATSEIVRVLDAGGYLIATIGNRLRMPWMLDPLYSPALTTVRGVAKAALGWLGRPWRSNDELPTNPVRAPEFRALLASAGLDVIRTATFGFGPFTLLGREVLPGRLNVTLNQWLQHLADRRIPIVRAMGAQHIALARKGAH
ncbi:MAG: Methylase involved in ubiquinone/menaquinone biosynthesis [Rhodospirillales bacterium]|jgi:ubiquinone/menaquinone biosynthesis C-methylase UbiE|nr:Methylase involved in ubiquinone/menaquinone biosynthesis [Rhodospirillales bacterium]